MLSVSGQVKSALLHSPVTLSVCLERVKKGFYHQGYLKTRLDTAVLVLKGATYHLTIK